MPFTSEHSARLIEPDKFQEDTQARQEVDTGIEILIGKLIGGDVFKTQSYRFDSDKFTPQEAKNWLKKHNINFILFEESKSIKDKIFLSGTIGEKKGITQDSILKAVKEGREIVLNTIGGDLFDGWAFHDQLKSMGVESIGVMGMCASSGIQILLAAKNRWATPNSRFIIHNPTLNIEGDAKAHSEAAAELIKEQGILVEKYVSISGKSKEEIQAIMSKDMPLTAQEALELNLITEIINVDNMNEQETKEKLTGLENMLSKVLNFVKPKPKNLVKQDVNGNELDFGEEIQSIEQIVVGIKATVNGEPANGEYTLEDGTVWNFEAGELKDIVPAMDEVEALKKENESLKAENESLKNSLEESKTSGEALKTEFDTFKNDAETQITEVKSEFDKFKNQFSEFKPNDNVPVKEKEKVKFSFKSNKN